LVGIKKIWSLNLYSNNNQEDTLVLSFIGHSKMLTFSNGEFEEIEFNGFHFELQTFYCGRTPYNKCVQITSNSVRLICLKSKKLISQWNVPTCKNITIVSCNNRQAVCATGNYLYYIEIESEHVYQKGYNIYVYVYIYINVLIF